MNQTPTICPRCYRMIGQTEWCPVCRAHNDLPPDSNHPDDSTPEPKEDTMNQHPTYAVTWHYQDAEPLTQGGFVSREHAEHFVRDAESQRKNHSHTHTTITPEPHDDTPNTFTHYLYVPDHMLNADHSVDPEKVRWHVVSRDGSGRGNHHVMSYPTIQEAYASLNGGWQNPTPVIPCGLFSECEHCSKTMANDAAPPSCCECDGPLDNDTYDRCVACLPAFVMTQQTPTNTYGITWKNADGISRTLTADTEDEAVEAYTRLQESPAVSIEVTTVRSQWDAFWNRVDLTPCSPVTATDYDHPRNHPDDCGCDDCDPETHSAHVSLAGYIRSVKKTLAAASLALALAAASHASAAPTAPAWLPAPPAGCEIAGVWEDHSAVAECNDATVAYDPDDGAWSTVCPGETLTLTDQHGAVHSVPTFDKLPLGASC